MVNFMAPLAGEECMMSFQWRVVIINYVISISMLMKHFLGTASVEIVLMIIMEHMDANLMMMTTNIELYGENNNEN